MSVKIGGLIITLETEEIEWLIVFSPIKMKWICLGPLEFNWDGTVI